MDNGDRAKRLYSNCILDSFIKREAVNKCLIGAMQEGCGYFESPLIDRYPQLFHALSSHKSE